MHKFWPPLLVCGSLLIIALMFVGTEASSITYYVSPTGNDKNVGTLSSPWKTIQKAANTVTAGNTVVVLPGTYNERVKFAASPSHSGDSGAPVTFKSETAGAATINGGFDTRNANYLIIDGFKITTTTKGGAGGGVLVGSNNVIIINNYFYNIPDAGIRGYNNTSIIPYDITIKNNQIIGNQFGVIVAGNRWLVENNEVTLKRLITGDLDYFQFNGSNLVFRHNYLHGTSFADKSTATVNGWQANVPTGKTFSNIEISGNLVESFDEGVGLAGVTANSFDNVNIFNNVFDGWFSERANMGGYGVYAKKYLSSLYIKHNTFANLATAGVRASNSSVATVQNNIFFNTNNGYYLDTKAIITGGYNLLNLVTKKTFNNQTDLINLNPLFNNQNSLLGLDNLPFTVDDGFNLQAKSPAINQALLSDIATDITGAQRPSGPKSDLGAYEPIYVAPDQTPPITSVSPEGGIYTTAQSVFLSTNEPAKTFYCFDLINATSTCQPSILIAGAINISDSGKLRFYSEDLSGNKEPIKEQSYEINLDAIAPETTAYPSGGAYPLGTNIAFLRNENGQTFYCVVASCTPTTLYTDPLSLSGPLTLRFYSVDQVGNRELVKEEKYTLTTQLVEPIEPVVSTTTEDTPIISDQTTNQNETNVVESNNLSGNSGDSLITTISKSDGGGGGNSLIKSSTYTATTSLTATSAPANNGSDVGVLRAKVVELQKTLINLLQQLIQKSQKVSDLATDSLAAVGSLFLMPFAL